MTLPEDAELLERYAESRDESAFAELVGRYVHVTYCAALRRLNDDAHLSQDVAQQVFTILAQNAGRLAKKLRCGQPLIGWLFTTTQFTASRVRRTESRRRRHESEAHQMNQCVQSTPEHPEVTQREIRPFLDEILNRLGTTDRNVVLLRFFASRELREVGAELGLSEEAVRKRLDRSLDRLRDYLARKGIRTGSAALAAAFAAMAVETAPKNVANAVAHQAFAASGVSATGTVGWGLPEWLAEHTAGILAGTAALVLLSTMAYWALNLKSASRMTFASVELPVDLGSTAPVLTTNAMPVAALLPIVETKQIIPDTIRFPKSLLRQIPLFSVEMTNSETREFVLSKEYSEILRITPTESSQLLEGIAKAMDNFRRVEGRHLDSTDEDDYDPFQRAPDWRILDHRTYILRPFPDEGREIRDQLNQQIHQTLGTERATLFIEAALLFNGEFKEQDTNPALVQTYTYRLVTNASGAFVDLHQASSRADGGGGAGGYDFGPTLDRYAPASVQPLLTQWRQWIADHYNKPGEKLLSESLEAKSNTLSDAPADDPRNEQTTWDEGLSYVNLPVRMLASLKIVGLDEKQKISPEAVTICELTPLEVQAAEGLYGSMKTRFMALEQEHFKRVEAAPKHFLLEAFPEESEALRLEWNRKLREILGEWRGETLDQLIRTPMSPMMQFKQRTPGRWDPALDWLHLGSTAIEAEIAGLKEGSNRSYPEFRYHGPDVGNGSFTLSQKGKPPIRWQHLLSPEILTSP